MALTIFLDVYRVRCSIICASPVILMVTRYGADISSLDVVALLVLGMYKDLTEQIGLRRVLSLNLCCAALMVGYSIASCKSCPYNHTFTIGSLKMILTIVD